MEEIGDAFLINGNPSLISQNQSIAHGIGSKQVIQSLPQNQIMITNSPVSNVMSLPPKDIRKKRETKAPKPKKLPEELSGEGESSNSFYENALHSKNITFNPKVLGFLPTSYWASGDITFGELVSSFFQRKNTSNCRFPHKLFDALSIVESNPQMFNLFGVKWLNDTIFEVDKFIFGRLLGLNSIDGGLFHGQGNFPSHGFVEVFDQIEGINIDHDRYRIIKHKDGLFTRNSKEDSITNCKWGGNHNSCQSTLEIPLQMDIQPPLAPYPPM